MQLIKHLHFNRQQFKSFERLILDCYLRFSLQYKFLVRPTVLANFVTTGFSNIGSSFIL